MKILGIETSCDETAAAIVQDGTTILSNVVASSLEKHKRYGGVIPEIASRHQLELINLVIQDTIKSAKIKLDAVDAIAVTGQPGLIGSLLVGVSCARALAFALKKPILEINHIKAHLYASFLKEKGDAKFQKPKLPAIGLVVSGGHTSLFYLKNYHDFELLGQTRDDAAGEAYDKVARILKLGYPGGPVIDRLAGQGKNNEIRFPCAKLPGNLDFSFSGIKTSVYYYAKNYRSKQKLPVKKVSYAFQKSVVDSLVKKSLEACQEKKVKTLIVGGGVAANSCLRETLQKEGESLGIKVFFPRLSLCMDNAAMIAGLGYHYLKNK